jgi:hypothetical protein
MANVPDIECHLIVFVSGGSSGQTVGGNVPWGSQEGEPRPTRMHTQAALLLIATSAYVN